MKIFKELKKLGYKHYTEHTVEELDNLPLDSKERIMDQALVLRWFREKYGKESYVRKLHTYYYHINDTEAFNGDFKSYEEAELECLVKLIEICKNK
jgi:hypothetical protein